MILMKVKQRVQIIWLKPLFNRFNVTGFFLYLLKDSDNWFSDVFRGHIEGKVLWNELILMVWIKRPDKLQFEFEFEFNSIQ